MAFLTVHVVGHLGGGGVLSLSVTNNIIRDPNIFTSKNYKHFNLQCRMYSREIIVFIKNDNLAHNYKRIIFKITSKLHFAKIDS